MLGLCPRERFSLTFSLLIHLCIPLSRVLFRVKNYYKILCDKWKACKVDSLKIDKLENGTRLGWPRETVKGHLKVVQKEEGRQTGHE